MSRYRAASVVLMKQHLKPPSPTNTSMRLPSQLTSFHWPRPRVRRLTSRISLFTIGGLVGLLTTTTWGSGAAMPLTPQDLHIEVPADSLYGSLPINRGLTVSVTIPEQPVRPGEPLVVTFETPASTPYTVPLELDRNRHRYAVTVDLGRLTTTMGDPPKATPVQIVVTRQQGLHVEELTRRTVVVTIATPGYADRSTGAKAIDLSPHLADSTRQVRVEAAGLTSLDARLEEQDLPGEGRPGRQEGYWKMLQGLIRRRMQDDQASHRNVAGQRMPGIGFRLYANGEAQLIEIERSSGDLELDQAALLAVVNAHPFPPFPVGTRDSHVDVHLNLPAFIR